MFVMNGAQCVRIFCGILKIFYLIFFNLIVQTNLKSICPWHYLLRKRIENGENDKKNEESKLRK